MTPDGPRFGVDDPVFLVSQKDTRSKELSSERFTVVAVMPRDRAGIHQYRLKPAGLGPLRMATELQLRR